MKGSWKMSLRNSFKNFRRDYPGEPQPLEIPPSKRMKQNEEDNLDDDDNYQGAIDELKAEYRKGKKDRNHSTVKQLMDTTLIRRRKWIMQERPLISEVLQKFSPLTTSKGVS